MKSSRNPRKSKHSGKIKKSSQVQKKTRDSTPPGVLNNPQIERFKTTQENVAKLPVESIQPYLLIPDYRDPTESIQPIVVQSPEGCYCIDGWNLIEQAKSAGQPAIRCYVFYVQEHSETELAIRKVAIRTKPQGGTCSFGELVRNTKLAEKILLDEMENPVVFSHGGARYGTNFTNNKEDDLREILVERLGKTRTTINDYLAFGRHLSDDALETLVAVNIGKAFFEKARVNKRTLIKNLESDGKAHEDITAEVSRKTLEWLAEYQETGEIKPDLGDPEPPAEAEDQSSETTADVSVARSSEVESFCHRSPPANNEVTESTTEESAKTAIQTIIDALSGLMEQSPFDCDQGLEIVDAQIGQLAVVRHMLIDIRSRTQQDQDKEAT